MSGIREELHRMCMSIAEELEGYEYGSLIYTDGEGFVDKTEENEDKDDGLSAWLGYVLDIRVITDLNGKDLYGVRLCVACGGPNIYVDTEKEIVEGYWGTEHVTCGLSGSVCSSIDDLIEEYRAC